MKYTRMKRFVYALLKEHKGEKKLVDFVIDDSIYNPMLNENTFWYLYDNNEIIFKELFKEGKIKKPKGYGEWVKDLI